MRCRLTACAHIRSPLASLSPLSPARRRRTRDTPPPFPPRRPLRAPLPSGQGVGSADWQWPVPDQGGPSRSTCPRCSESTRRASPTYVRSRSGADTHRWGGRLHPTHEGATSPRAHGSAQPRRGISDSRLHVAALEISGRDPRAARSVAPAPPPGAGDTHAVPSWLGEV